MALATLSIDLVAKTAQLERDMREAAKVGQKGTQAIQQSLDDLKSFASNFLLGMAAGMAAAFSVGQIKQFVAANVEAADELDRLSKSTGVSVEKLSQWGAVARRNHLDVGDLAEQVNELQARLGDTADATEGAGYALKQIGLDYKALKKLSSEDAFEQVAIALSKVEDSGKKAALAMAVGGDEYQKYIPVLNAIGAGGLAAAAVTEEQARAAARYKDRLAELTTAGDTWAQTVTAGIVPALDEGAHALIDVLNGTNGLTAEARKLARDGTITEWSRGGVTALTYLADAVEVIVRSFRIVGQTIGADLAIAVEAFGTLGTAARLAIEGEYGQALDAVRGGISRVKTISADASETLDALWSDETLGAKMRARIADIQSVGVATEAAAEKGKGKIGVAFDPAAAKLAKEMAEKYRDLVGGIKDKITAYQAELGVTVQLTEAEKQRSDTLRQMLNKRIKLTEQQQASVRKTLDELVATEALALAHRDINKLRTDNAAAQAELDYGKALTDGQKAALAWMERLRDGRIQMTEEQRRSIAAQYEQALATQAEIGRQKELIQWLDTAREANASTTEAGQQRLQALRDQIETERQAAEEVGLSADALATLQRARQLDTARALEARAAAMDNIIGLESQTAAWREQADAIRELVDLQRQRFDAEMKKAADPFKGATDGVKDYIEELRKAGDAAKAATSKTLSGLEDQLTSMITTGKADWKSLIDTMIAEAARLGVVRPLMTQLLGDGSAGSGGGAVAGWLSKLYGNGKSSGGGMDSFNSWEADAGFKSSGSDWMTAIAGFFGGGRASGGPVAPGTLYDINERGMPEVLTVGNRSMLMMGAEGGQVTPIDIGLPSRSSSGGSQQPVIHQTFNFSGADTVTRAEMQRAAADAKAAALAEWRNNRSRGMPGYT